MMDKGKDPGKIKYEKKRTERITPPCWLKILCLFALAFTTEYAFGINVKHRLT